MSYKFTSKLPNQVCRICGETFDKKWSSGGIGAVCQTCSPVKDKLDLVKEDLVRNIKEVKSEHTSNGLSYEFEACIDGTWYKCSHPCGNWAMVKGWPEKHDIFSVPVGWWELSELYQKHGATVVTARRCYKCNNEVQVYMLEKSSKATAICSVCGNSNTYHASAEA
jgi:Zn ribbon nucleic-acid-binding protein